MTEIESKPQSNPISDELHVCNTTGLIMLPEGHPEYMNIIRLQLENRELMKWKSQLQTRINAERAEYVKLKNLVETQPPKVAPRQSEKNGDDERIERIISHYTKENNLLEQKKLMLSKEIFEENSELVQLQVELELRNFQI